MPLATQTIIIDQFYEELLQLTSDYLQIKKPSVKKLYKPENIIEYLLDTSNSRHWLDALYSLEKIEYLRMKLTNYVGNEDNYSIS